MRRGVVSVLMAGALAVAALASPSSTARAHVLVPCDFTTGGGWVLDNQSPPDKANFGLVGGCKNGGWFGHVNFLDHGLDLHMSSTQITGYVDPCFSTAGCPSTVQQARDICGTAKTDLFGPVVLRVRTIDAEQQSPALAKDRFGIEMTFCSTSPCSPPGSSLAYLLTTRALANGGVGGGDIELHKPNPSSTSTLAPMCPDDFGMGF